MDLCGLVEACLVASSTTARGSSQDALDLEAHPVNSTPYRTHIAHAYFLARGSRLSSRLSAKQNVFL